MEKDFGQSSTLHKRIIKPEHGECFPTAVKVCQLCAKAWYVEGFIIENGERIAHGWNEINGKIVDAQQPEYNGSYEPQGRCDAPTILAFVRDNDTVLPRWVSTT